MTAEIEFWYISVEQAYDGKLFYKKERNPEFTYLDVCQYKQKAGLNSQRQTGSAISCNLRGISIQKIHPPLSFSPLKYRCLTDIHFLFVYIRLISEMC